MLYTVTPLERIYTDRTKSNIQSKEKEEKSTEVERCSFDVERGKIYTRKEGKDYIIEGIQSTDMEDYLNPLYSPGNNFPCN
ncbi:YlzJ-like family protein [Anaerocolumna xylanovorans]|uniref:YlzJ-like protein n=1 Tax=Anaerocolumna xylanovorans DSM 12503 TaxID=1121345 RepID=A0A1M7YLQ4_9FIRM|nr:YlzJ-like family protein [Anaerocolumna xylanovorans]SHO53527.1 YlzJ-like protein [Anaerocolumna xylanovorans DSM 12503]